MPYFKDMQGNTIGGAIDILKAVATAYTDYAPDALPKSEEEEQ